MLDRSKSYSIYILGSLEMKKKIGVIVGLLLIVAILTTGALAYFTTENRTATGHIQSGTLDLKIAAVVPSAACPATIDQIDVTLWDLSNIAPGDVVTGKLCMKNDGSLPIEQVVFNWSGMPELLAEHLFVTHLVNSVTGDEIADYIAFYDENSDGYMSIAELKNQNFTWALPPYTGTLDEYWGTGSFLPVGGTQWVEYTFEFDKNAGNALQDKVFDYVLTIVGLQKVGSFY
jgi:hypothetical protein